MFGLSAEKRGVTPDVSTRSNLGTVQAANNTAALQSALNTGEVVSLTYPGTYTFNDTLAPPARTR